MFVSQLVSPDYKKSMQPELRPGWRQVVVQCITNRCTQKFNSVRETEN